MLVEQTYVTFFSAQILEHLIWVLKMFQKFGKIHVASIFPL